MPRLTRYQETPPCFCANAQVRRIRQTDRSSESDGHLPTLASVERRKRTTGKNFVRAAHARAMPTTVWFCFRRASNTSATSAIISVSTWPLPAISRDEQRMPREDQHSRARPTERRQQRCQRDQYDGFASYHRRFHPDDRFPHPRNQKVEDQSDHQCRSRPASAPNYPRCGEVQRALKQRNLDEPGNVAQALTLG